MNEHVHNSLDLPPITLAVEGMTCASCVRRVELAAGKVEGVDMAAVNLATETLTVTPTPKFSADALAAAIRKAGYEVKAETIELEIEEMTCASCVARVEKALKAVPSVESASVNLATARALVTVLGGRSQLPALIAAVKTAGYGARAAASVEQTGGRDEAREKEISRLTRDVWLALVLTLPVFVAEMGAHLYPPLHHTLMDLFPGNTLNYTQFVLSALVLAGPGRRFFVKGFPALVRLAPDMNSLVAVGTSAAFLYSLVTTFAPELLPAEARHVYYEAAVVIVTLILLGRLLEARAKGRTGEAIRKLAGLRAKTARVERNGVAVDIPAGAVTVGDVVVIRPGERLPVDGRVLDGHSFVDESMISGEPVPAEKAPGAVVIGGTINGNGSFRFTAEKVGGDTMLAQIIRMVGEAQGAKLPIQLMVDKVTAWFVPAVMALSALTFLVWLLLGPEPAYTYGLIAAVAVLIIACPCAMGLATPTSIMVGTGRAAEMGVLFRKGEALQGLTEADTVILDKTGTITMGRPDVTDIVPAEGFDAAEILALAASVEARSEHPLAEAVVKAAKARGLVVAEAQDLKAVTGYGIAATVAGRRVEVGADRFMAKLGYGAFGDVADAAPAPHPASTALGDPLPASGARGNGAAGAQIAADGAADPFSPLGGRRWRQPDEGPRAEPERQGTAENVRIAAAAAHLASEGKTPIYVAVDGEVAAVIAIADPLKETSVAAIRALKSLGFSVVMATGDNRATARAVARAAGVDEVAAELLPEGKVEAIRARQGKGRKVIFVGDGINDAPALAAADTGVAIGTGTDVAIESADVVLVKGDLVSAVQAIEIGRAVIRNIGQNLFWAFGYNVALIPVAAGALYPAFGILLSPMIGAGAMGLSSVFVLANALRLKRFRPSAID